MSPVNCRFFVFLLLLFTFAKLMIMEVLQLFAFPAEKVCLDYNIAKYIANVGCR